MLSITLPSRTLNQRPHQPRQSFGCPPLLRIRLRWYITIITDQKKVRQTLCKALLFSS